MLPVGLMNMPHICLAVFESRVLLVIAAFAVDKMHCSACPGLKAFIDRVLTADGASAVPNMRCGPTGTCSYTHRLQRQPQLCLEPHAARSSCFWPPGSRSAPCRHSQRRRCTGVTVLGHPSPKIGCLPADIIRA